MVDRVELELGGVEGGADGVVDVGLAALAVLLRRAGTQAATKARVMSSRSASGS